MKKKQERDREHAIKSYLKGETITAIAQKLGYGGRGATSGLSAIKPAKMRLGKRSKPGGLIVIRSNCQ